MQGRRTCVVDSASWSADRISGSVCRVDTIEDIEASSGVESCRAAAPERLLASVQCMVVIRVTRFCCLALYWDV